MNKLNKTQIKSLSWAIAKGIAAVETELKKIAEGNKECYFEEKKIKENAYLEQWQKDSRTDDVHWQLAFNKTKKEQFEKRKKELEEILKEINS